MRARMTVVMRRMRPGVGGRQGVGRHEYYAAMADPTFGDDMLGEMADIVGLAPQDCHLHAVIVVEVGVHRRQR